MGFEFTQVAIDPAGLARFLADPGAGGFASFEGRVRDRNQGQAVTRLEYEAYEVLALAEGARIVAGASARHGARAAHCVHRLGRLEVGEIAVWVGVLATHRAEAFAACRQIIDEVKHRLPIWKKEHYAGGDSGWVNCDHCAAHADAGPGFDYSRQLALPEIGVPGQARLARASVVVIGAGGLGCPLLAALAGAGIGTIHIVDDDVVEAANLHRQPLYTAAELGRPKAVAAAGRLSAYNPSIRVQPHVVRATAGNIGGLLEMGEVVVDCSDNFQTKFLVNDAAVAARLPAVLASVYQYEGQLQVVRADRDAACLRCQWPQATRDGLVGNCSATGVLGPVPAALGALQAMEVLKLLLDLPGQLQDEVLLIDLLDYGLRRLRAPRNPDCRAHDSAAAATDSEPAAAELEVAMSLAEAEARGYRIIDIRNPDERVSSPIPSTSHEFIPMTRLLGGGADLDPESHYLLVCAHGIRSKAAAQELRARGSPNVWSLKGGIAGR